MAKDKRKRQTITLVCIPCNRRTYTTTKNRANHPGRLERKKYCRFCRGHFPHREAR